MESFAVKITSNGTVMRLDIAVMSVDVIYELNRVPHAQIVLLDGSIPEKTFPLSDEAFFEPGQLIEITLKYEADSETEFTVFKGLVVQHTVEASISGSTLTLELKDEAVKLTGSRKSMIFLNETDDKVFKTLISSANLKAGKISATKATHKQLVQYHCTDWDFMLSRAESNGLVVSVDQGTLSLVEVDLSAGVQHTFEYGLDGIYDFEMQVNAEYQYGAVDSVAWDVKEQKATKTTDGKDFPLEQGNLKGATLAKKFGFESVTLNEAVALAPEELQAWSNATLIRSRMSMIRGRISIAGQGDIKLLDMIELTGIGNRFNGKTLVTGVRHRVSSGGWRTDIQFGLSPDSFARQRQIIEPPAAGLLPAVMGLQIGIVDKFEADPDKELRVKVKLPSLGKDAPSIWARLATPDAGKERGYFFYPEPNDEVIVGFFNNDPRQAVILGSMFGSKNALPKDLGDPTADNIHKAIFSKKGAVIGFIDDKKPSVFIETPAGSTVLLDDQNEAIMLKDQHGNSVLMNKDGIEIKSAKDIIIDAGSGKIEIKGTKVDIK